MRVLSLFTALLLFFTALATPTGAVAQNPNADVVMVLPFENTSNRAEYNWVGESFADALAELLNKPGLNSYACLRPSSPRARPPSNSRARPKRQ